MSDTDKPWLHEGNALDFVCQKTGYQIALRRHPELLHWCGYAGIPPEHPWHGRAYQDVEEHVRVHGGLTYSHNSVPGSEEGAIWWFGFDCAHCHDLVPGIEIHRLVASGDVYRDIEYVKNEAIDLAEQLATVAPKKKASVLDINRMFG